MTLDEFKEAYDALVSRLRTECGSLVDSADSVGCSDDLTVVNRMSVERINNVLQTMVWLEDRKRKEIKEPEVP